MNKPIGEIFVTPLECTLCKKELGISNVIAGVLSESKETYFYLHNENLNFLCPQHLDIMLQKVGLEK